MIKRDRKPHIHPAIKHQVCTQSAAVNIQATTAPAWTHALAIQPKLTINQPGDAYEQEAETVAAQVLRMPAPGVQRACACGGTPDDTGECPACRAKRLGIQRQSTSAEAVAAPPSVHTTLRTSGQPLDADVRAFLEPRFGYDFSQVRVHTNPQAAESAKAVNAHAYTVGQNVVFGAGQYQPHSSAGQKLLAHELTHVVQQANTGVQRLARTPLDLQRLDDELFWGEPLTQTSGEIGAGATRGRSNATPGEDPALPIQALIFPRNTDATPTTGSSTGSGTSGTTPPETAEPVAPPIPSPRTVTEPSDRSRWRMTTYGLLAPARRALVIGGIHGNERGPLDIMRQLRAELSANTNPLARDFDTIVIPEMNPGGVADRSRGNRRGVDLNRNFPGLRGFPSASGPVPPEQPEVRAVRQVIEILQPDRILALHAITGADKGGVYADPVEGRVARELACRMALRMRGTPLPRGGMSGASNVAGNELENNVCSVRYPETAAVSVTTAQSSLGAWASAPTSVGGRATPVITHEVSGKSALPQSGAGRSVDTMMPGIREFLLDNEHMPSEADALLRQAVSNAFLTGQGTNPADVNLVSANERIVSARFNDMNAFYHAVWRPQQPASVRGTLPANLTIVSPARTFREQTRIASRALGRQALFQASSTDAEIQQAILNVMQTISLPGFSRHHWGTEIDVVSATRTDWEGTGTFVPLIPFMRDVAPQFGFFHPYSDQRPSATLPHYENEPWHLSYWPIANVLQQEWATRFTGTVLNNLISETARAIHGPIDQARMEGILGSIGLENFQTNVALSP
jgi:hypothetical protein